MSDVIQFLKGIGDFFVTIANFVVDFFQDIVYIIESTAKAIAKIPEYLDWLPASFVAVLIVIFGIVVIYKITGREG